jgi:hypothetical protein
MAHNEDTKDNATMTPATDLETPGAFDPANLRLSQDFAQSVGVKKTILTVPVRKPGRQDFVRVHPDPEYRLETAVLELKEERETYLVDRALWSDVPGEITPKVLLTAMTRQNVFFLWPIRLPGEDGRHDEWNRSALDAATSLKGAGSGSLPTWDSALTTFSKPPGTSPTRNGQTSHSPKS